MAVIMRKVKITLVNNGKKKTINDFIRKFKVNKAFFWGGGLQKKTSKTSQKFIFLRFLQVAQNNIKLK